MSTTPRERSRMVLTIEPVPDPRTPADVRLRRLLKSMLRMFGWRCVEARPADAGAAAERVRR